MPTRRVLRVTTAVFSTALLGGLVPAAQAQQPPNIAVIRDRPTISQIDAQAISRWLDDSLAQLASSSSPDTDGQKFFAALMEQYRASNATPAFRQAVARSLSEVFVKRYTPPAAGQTGPVLATVYPLLALRTFKDPSAFPAFQKALTDPSPGVRLAALDGLLSIRDQIPVQQWQQLQPNLQSLGAAETDPTVLDRLFKLLSVTDAQRAPLALATVTRIMETRLPLLEQKRQWPVLADGQITAWLAGRLAGANPQTRTTVVRIIARVLADAVFSYLNQNPNDVTKEQLERVIQISEQQLRTAVGASVSGGDVSAAMLSGGPAQAQKMNAELDRWIGANGALTRPPFSLPAGLGIVRPPPASAPATEPG